MEYVLKQTSEDVIQSILNNRELTREKVEQLLKAGGECWEDTDNYENMDLGYKELIRAIENNDLIGILVDPDVDGYTSGTSLMMFLTDDLKYDNVVYIIQDQRHAKCHGISSYVMKKIKEHGIKLLFTPDGASSDFDYHRELAELGVKHIALDHHIYDKTVETPSIIINNNCDTVHNKNGSGCLVTYKFIDHVAYKEKIDLEDKYCDLVYISIIGDMMDMTSLENRYFSNVFQNIKYISNPLIQEFCKDLRRKNTLTIENISYGISNRMNSIIRMGTDEDKDDLFNALLGSEEMVEYTYRGQTKVRSLQQDVIRKGDNLKKKQKEATKKSMEFINYFTTEEDKIIIVDGKNIDKSCTGLIANKLSNEFCKPVLILKPYKDELRGSVRGFKVDGFKTMCEESQLITFAEGHELSFGLGLLESNLQDFITYMNERLKDFTYDVRVPVDFAYDGFMPYGDMKEVAKLSSLWCKDIQKPVFLIRNVTVDLDNDVEKVKANVKMKSGKNYYTKEFCPRDVFEQMVEGGGIQAYNFLCEIKINDWNNRPYVNIIDYERINN